MLSPETSLVQIPELSTDMDQKSDIKLKIESIAETIDMCIGGFIEKINALETEKKESAVIPTLQAIQQSEKMEGDERDAYLTKCKILVSGYNSIIKYFYHSEALMEDYSLDVAETEKIIVATGLYVRIMDYYLNHENNQQSLEKIIEILIKKLLTIGK